MDVDNILNFERRTGVKNEEIEDFERKANAVQAAIEGLRLGTVKPEDIKIEGIETEEEKKQKELERLERLRKLKERDDKVKAQRKIEEKERWWAGAELFVQNKKKPETNAFDSKSSAMSAKLEYHALNYSKWNNWVPTDEVSINEREEEERKAEEAKNKEFEANNAEFCGQFMEDMKKREASIQKKKEDAEKARKTGNKFYAVGKYERALDLYFESLRELPYDVSTLNNIAQVYSKQKNIEDAMEFTSRVLHIDENHVKALYRKANMLAKQLKITEALEVITKAASVDANDANVKLLLKDIQAMDRELREEEKLKRTVVLSESAIAAGDVSSTGIAPNALAPSEGGSADQYINAIDNLTLQLTQFTTEPSQELSDQIIASMQALSPVVEKQLLYKTYTRTSETLSLCLQYLTALLAASSSPTSSGNGGGNAPVSFDYSNNHSVNAIKSCLDFVTSAVGGQRSSQQQIMDTKIVTPLKSLLSCCCVVGATVADATTGGDVTVTHKLHLSAAVLKLFALICTDDVCAKLKLFIVSDADVLFTLLFTMRNMSDALSVEKNLFARVSAVLTIITSSCTLIKECAVYEGSAKLFTKQIGDIVPAVSAVLNHILRVKTTANTAQWDIDYFPLADTLVGTLFYLSRFETLRSYFAVPLSSSTASSTSITTATTATEKTTVGVLVLIVNTQVDLAVNALSTLTNACMGTGDDTVRNAVVSEGGLACLLTNLSLSEVGRAKVIAIDSNLLVRKAGLLSRLVSLSIVQTTLSEGVHFRHICQRLRVLVTTLTNGAEENTTAQDVEKWQSDERAHYIRIFASLRKLSAENRTIAVEENVLVSILEVFPMPRTDLNTITAESVIKIPARVESPLLLSSATKCLLLLLDCGDTNFAKTLFLKSGLYGTEKLVCALSTCTERTVKKDIASALSKGCAVGAEIKEKIRSFRGIEIIVDLGRRGEI